MALDEVVSVSDRPSEAVGKGAAQRRRVVDADAHLDPPYEMWADYLPAHLKDQAPRIEAGEEHDWIVFEGRKRPVMMISNQAGRTGKDYKMFGRRSEMRKVWEPAQRLADMDQDGLDAAVLFGGGPLGTASPELYIASFEAYNRWLWDFCAADRRRLKPVAYVPTRDVEETLRMLRDLAKLGFRSVNLPAFPQAADGISTSARVQAINSGQGAALTGDPSGGRSYADAEWQPMWALFAELDMTVTMHLGGRVPRFGEKKYFLADMPMSKVAMIEPVAILIFNGVFQQFPNLRLVTVESGVGWMAWVAEYMDRTWEKQRYWTESTLTEKPSFFMDRNVYGSFINDRVGILNRGLPGGHNIMWSSDYPHSETTFPNSHAVIERDFVGVPEDDIREIICERARRIYFVD
jgi:predicted TIM-barrel fold metal-dependent hydrolase